MTNSGANTDYCTISFMSLENRHFQGLCKSSVLARVKISTVRVTECYSKSQCGFPVPTGRTSHAIRRRLVSSRKLLHAPGSTEVSEEDRQTKTRQIQNSPEAVSLCLLISYCIQMLIHDYMERIQILETDSKHTNSPMSWLLVLERRSRSLVPIRKYIQRPNSTCTNRQTEKHISMQGNSFSSSRLS